MFTHNALTNDKFPYLPQVNLTKLLCWWLDFLNNCSNMNEMLLIWLTGFVISFGIRCNLGVAIVQMTSNSSETGVSHVLFELNSSESAMNSESSDVWRTSNWPNDWHLHVNSRNLTGSQERSVWWILPSSGATWSPKSRAVSWPPNTQPTSKTSLLRHFTWTALLQN